MIQASSHGLVYQRDVPLFALWALLSQSVALNAQICVGPDGNVDLENFSPCNESAELSHCCNEGDLCLTNSYCFGPGIHNNYRASCTDSTWKDPACPYYCDDVDMPNDFLQVIPIEANSDYWCCGTAGYNNNTRLCNHATHGSSAPFQLANSVIIYNRTNGDSLPDNTAGQSSTTTVTLVSTASVTVPHVSAATVTSFPATQHSNNHDLSIGLGVGIPLGVLLLLTTSPLLRQLRQKKKQSPKVAEVSDVVQNAPGHPVNYDPYSSKPELAGYRANRVISPGEVPEKSRNFELVDAVS